jgi:acyl-coenzyme A thioesterase 9
MVTLEPNGKRSVPNVPLLLETDEERKLFEKGECKYILIDLLHHILDAKNARKTREENSLFKSPPTEIERAIIHDIFIKSMDSNNIQNGLPPNHIRMSDAKLKNTVVCFPIKRNM